jgi:cell cycle sensor histidine kinase DivJ
MRLFENLFPALAGRGLHALWVGLCAFAFMSAPPPLTPMAVGGFALAALPGFLGLGLAGSRLARFDGSRLVLALAWTLPGMVAALAYGTAMSLAALIFLAGPVTIAASLNTAKARMASVLSALAFILCAAAGLPGPLSAGAGPLIESAQVWAAFAGYLALAGLVARTRLELRVSRLERTVRDTAPAAEAFARAPSPLMALDRTGIIKAASKAIRRIVPGTPHSLNGLNADGLAFDEAAQDAVRTGLVSAREGGSADGGCFTFTVRDRDGSAQRVDARAVATPDGYVLTLECARNSGEAARTDTPSDPIATPEELARLKAERDAAIAANRSKSEFLAAVSHELRTPLNAIIGFSDMMKQRIFGPLPARYAEYGDLIHESGTHLLDLIGDVLDMSKIEADRYELETEEFDARDVVEICSKMLRLRAEEKQVALSTDVGDRPLMVEADRKALRQILLNLLSNAVKFTPEGGAVVAMVQPQDGALVLAVGDSGVGISADELSGVGHAWNQAQSARDSDERGSGLGLSLVRALAELHGGSMSVQSAPGEGTTVSVILPVLVDAGLEPAGTDAALEVHQRIKAAQSLGEELQSNATA